MPVGILDPCFPNCPKVYRDAIESCWWASYYWCVRHERGALELRDEHVDMAANEWLESCFRVAS